MASLLAAPGAVELRLLERPRDAGLLGRAGSRPSYTRDRCPLRCRGRRAEVEPAVAADGQVGHVQRLALQEHFRLGLYVPPAGFIRTTRIRPRVQSPTNRALRAETG